MRGVARASPASGCALTRRSSSSSSTAVYGSHRARRDLVDQRLEPRALGDRRRRASSSCSATSAAQLVAQPRAPARRRSRRRPRGYARCAPIASHSSSTPSPSVATVRTIGGRHAVPDRARACPSRSLTRLVGAGPIGLVHDEDVGDLEQPGLRRLHLVAPTRVHDDDRRVGLARDLDLDLADADRLDDRSTACRPRRARAPPAASRARARRGGRASPSSG